MPKRLHIELYYVHTMPGLESIAWSEVRSRLANPSLKVTKRLPKKNGLALFSYAGPPRALLGLRTTEDAFFLVKHVPRLEWGFKGVSQVYASLLENRSLERGLAIHSRVTGRAHKRRVAFRVISRMSGKKQPYRRLDLGKAVQKALEKRSRGKWHAVSKEEDVEIWANLIDRDFICGLRLSDASMRHRDYKVAHISASLRPSVAASLAWLTDPQPTDTFVDPMCGAGTVLIERAAMGRYSFLLGGDEAPHVLRAARENLGSKYQPWQLLRWDARHLPMAARSVDKVATNLPFGIKVGDGRKIGALYRAFFRELDRVLTPTGCAAIMSNRAEAIKSAARENNGLEIVKGYAFEILGRDAVIHLIRRPASRRGGTRETVGG